MSALFLFASLGVINGVLLSIYLLAKKDRARSDLYFAGLLLALCLRIGKSVMVYFDPELDKLILQIGLSACIFIGPFYYLYTRSVLRSGNGVQLKASLTLFLLLAAILIAGIVYPYRQFPEYWNAYIVQGIYLIWAAFTVLGLYENRNVFGRFFKARVKVSLEEKRLLAISIAFVFITLTYQFALFIQGVTYIWGSLIFSVSFYYLLIRTLIEKKAPVPKSSSPLENGTRLFQELESLMRTQKPHLNPKLKLDELADLSEMSRHQLSRLLNEEYPHGFSQYIKEHRVAEAKGLIQTRDELSLEGIGYEAGFNSKSAFFEAFKKVTGQTPAAFKKAIDSELVAISPD